MGKIMVIPKNKEMIEKLIKVSDAFLIGIKGLSFNLPFYYLIEEIEELIIYLNNEKREVFVALNKNIKNEEIPYLEEVMLKLNQLPIKGVFFYDVALIEIWEKHSLKYDLVWAQEHFVTNYETCNYFKQLGVNYGLLASEITLAEIKEIIKKSPMKFILPVFGYLPICASFRHLVNNYLDHFNLPKVSIKYFMEKENKSYQIIDDDNGTIVYSNNIINGLAESQELKEAGLSYLLLNSFSIDDDKFIKVVTMFNQANKENSKQLDNEIFEMFNNVDKGFLYNETVYKVK